MRNFYVILVSLFFLQKIVSAQTTVANQLVIQTPITSSGTSVNALLKLPDDYTTSSAKYPILIFLHGMGEAGTNLANIYNSSSAGGPAYFIANNQWPASFVNPSNGQSYKFIVLSPQAASYSISGPQLDYVINFMVNNYRVDTNRIYITGISAGGDGLVSYVRHNGVNPTHKAAAIVPMSAAISTPLQSWGSTIVADSIRAWGFGSYAQDIYGQNTSLLMDAMNNASAGFARFTNYSGGHCCWNQFYNPSYTQIINGVTSNIYQWLLGFSRNSSITSNQPPLANAGSDKTITLPVNTVSLTGSGTDADGTIAGYQWTKVSGPSTFTIVSPTQASTTINNLVQGVYSFELKVTDNLGATGNDTLNIIVNSAVSQANQLPVANAGPDQTITLPTDSVILNGSGSYDSDGNIVLYQWSTVSGPTSSSTHHTLSGGRAFTLNPDAQGYLVINNASNTYLPGDTIFLNGYFKSVAVYNMSGSDSNYIVFSNKPNQTLIIGDSLWSGGAWAQGFIFRNCHNIEIAGTNKNDFKIVGSNSSTLDANGYPVRTAYIDLGMSELSDRFVVHDVSIRHGGVGIFAKTEVLSTDARTWFPHTYLNNWEFYNLEIFNTYNEAMYIGHTAAYWNINTNTPYYPLPTDPTPDSTIYKLPIKLTNVKIHDNFIHDIGNDGIQTAAIDGLELYNNEVTNWATKHGLSDNGGILVGGRVKGFNVHDNYVHNAWGELMQVYAEGGATSIINNNLLVRNGMDGVSFRGSNNLIVNFSNNTVAFTGENAVRVNGYYGQTSPQIMNKNLLINPKTNGGTIYGNAYIYTENGASVTEGTSPNDNKKFATIASANVDTLNYYQPNVGSPSVGYGYVRNTNSISSGTHVIVSPNSPITTVRALIPGVYIFRLTVTDNQGGVSTDDIQVTVNAASNQPPVANAGSDKTITLPVNTVSLTGSGTDADGTIAGYQWTKVSGPSTFTIVSPTQASTTINNLVQGVYSFELKVTDNLGAVGRDTVQVTVNAASNQPPVANAGSDKTITLPVNTVSLTGSGTDADGIIASYQWSKISGPSQFTILSPTQPNTNINSLVQGVYAFELRVTDNLGAIGKDTVIVTVNATQPVSGNQTPIANAGPDQTINLPVNSISLNGSGTDADGTIVAYQWTMLSGAGQCTISNSNQSTTGVTGLSAGNYIFELKVTDNQGATGRDTMTVTVNADTRLRSSAQLYPNPAIDNLNIKIDAVTNTSNTNLWIYDERGILVYQEQFVRSQQVMLKQLDISKYSKGVYFIVIDVDINNRQTLKFIKQ